MFFGAPIKDVRLMRKSSGVYCNNISKLSVLSVRRKTGLRLESLTEYTKFRFI